MLKAQMNYLAAELRSIKMNFYLIYPDAEDRGILLIKNALKLSVMLDQLETHLQDRYYKQFLEVLSEEEIEDRPLDTQTIIWPF